MSEALLLGLAVSAALVLAESAGLVAAIPTFGALVRGSDALLRVWLDVATVVVPLGAVAALVVRALGPGSERRSAALVAVLLAPVAAALLHAASLGAPMLGVYAKAALLGVGALVLGALLALAIAAWRARPTLRSVATAGLVLAVLALGTALQWITEVRSRARLSPDWPALLLACGVAALPLALALARAHRRRVAAPLLASLAAYALLGAAGAHLIPEPAEPELERHLAGGGAQAESRPPVILIVADTLRADFVSALGAPAGTTPHIDALARDGILFANTRATAPWTTPSFASLLTSTYPSEHGAGERVGPERLRRRGLSRRVTTLPEVLSREGYATAAVVSNPFLGGVYGLGRGFQSYQNLHPTRSYYPISTWLHDVLWFELRPRYPRAYVRGDRETVRVRDRLDVLRRGARPFALLAHYMDTHRPYQAFRGFRDGETAPAEVASYRAAVRFLDEEVGEVVEALREAGLYDRALVVFTADHGEELSEDRLPGDYDHGHTLHRELLRVPLIVKLPGQRLAGTRRSEGASLIDVAPTVLAALGIRAPQGFRGVDLLAEGAPRDALRDRTLFAETLLQVPEQKAAIRGELKVILDSLPPRPEHAVGYDRSSDPQEERPLPVGHDPRFEPLYAALAAHVAEARDAQRSRAPALGTDLRRDLRALGYAR